MSPFTDTAPPPYSSLLKPDDARWWAANGASLEAAYIRDDDREIGRLVCQIFEIDPLSTTNLDRPFPPIGRGARWIPNARLTIVLLSLELSQILDRWSMISLLTMCSIFICITSEWMKYRDEKKPRFGQALIQSMMVYTVSILDLTILYNIGIQLFNYYIPIFSPRTSAQNTIIIITTFFPYLFLRLFIYWGPAYLSWHRIGWSEVHPIIRGYVDEMTIHWYMPSKRDEGSRWSVSLGKVRRLRRVYAQG